MIDIAIIGGGASGTLLLLQLLRQTTKPLRIAIFDRTNRFARGVAYGTADAQHLLNVRCSRMGAFAEEPDHFFRWLQNNPEQWQPFSTLLPHADSFLSRKLYGNYLNDLLQKALSDPNNKSQIHTHSTEVTELKFQSDVWQIQTKGQSYLAKQVVLALGNYPPRFPLKNKAIRDHPNFIHQPWSGSLEKIPSDQSVLILGTGLTAIDQLITLFNQQNHQGPVYVLSRRGLFPQSHLTYNGLETFYESEPLPQTAHQLMRDVRRKNRKLLANNRNWQVTVESLRPWTQKLWKMLSLEDKKRLLRHAMPYWDIHRHRCAPILTAQLQQWQLEKRFTLHSGRLFQAKNSGDQFKIYYRPRKQLSIQSFTCHWIINGTGLEQDYTKIIDPLVQNLLKQKIIVPHPLKMGLEVDFEGRLLNGKGKYWYTLFTLGPPRRGSLLETTAIPEIRSQAKQLAELLLQNL